MRACLVIAALLSLAAQKDANAAHAACALRDLGRQASPYIPKLVAMLDDGSPVDPGVCGERTWRFRGGQALTTPGEQAATALVAIGDPVKPVFLKALGAPAWVARRNAAWGLGALDASEAVPALVEALKDTDAGVREQVAWALGAIGDHRAVTGLTHALKDSDAGVRKQAAWALGAIGG